MALNYRRQLPDPADVDYRTFAPIAQFLRPRKMTAMPVVAGGQQRQAPQTVLPG
jgi:hypothetical protein